MANTELYWPDYVKLGSGVILIRSNHSVTWDKAVTFMLDEAEDLADYLKILINQSRRENPDVQELTEDLSNAEAEITGNSWKDFALALHRKGYRKQ